MGIGEFIRSGAFSVGGHEFAVAFYPDGFNSYTSECISIRLELLSKDDETMARACCDLRLLDHTTGLHCSVGKAELTMLSPADRTRRFTTHSMARNKFEASPYLRDDHLTIECILTVKQFRVSKTEFLNGIEVPPSNIKEQLSELLDAAVQVCEDVTFSVRGETFTASRKVLALRSPVFKAELYGPMSEGRAKHLTIEDMQPAVFRALLHFINTDSLPADVDHQHHGGDSSSTDCEMIWHLLEAADRYAVERLKVLCESILCKNLDAETVSTTLDLALQHNCEKFRDICVEFVSSPHVIDAVVATQGYQDLKTCPSAVIEMFEKTLRFNNT
ncbi:unnamed protein product [Urochloa decumbens]|uniref:BTB domain-containing protein n=1 Tax=Urochloa decumbens TaxID=240449 RepID=A0ABC9BAP4_9POAL